MCVRVYMHVSVSRGKQKKEGRRRGAQQARGAKNSKGFFSLPPSLLSSLTCVYLHTHQKKKGERPVRGGESEELSLLVFLGDSTHALKGVFAP